LIFTETPLAGAYLIEPQLLADNRGLFARVFCENEFAEHGLHTRFVQTSISFNVRRGTLRGLHYQSEPHGEIKVVRCTMGAIYDVIVDLRPQSPTYKQWYSVELTANNRRMLYIPVGMAHGFQTLTDDSEVFYMMGTFYHPPSATGVRWNDPTFAIEWVDVDERIISEKDQNWADFRG
jgi:dTDP-4-dehydrorhamnose 3,5-epimerase